MFVCIVINARCDCDCCFINSSIVMIYVIMSCDEYISLFIIMSTLSLFMTCLSACVCVSNFTLFTNKLSNFNLDKMSQQEKEIKRLRL